MSHVFTTCWMGAVVSDCWNKQSLTVSVAVGQRQNIDPQSAHRSSHVHGCGPHPCRKQPSKNLEERDTTSSPVADFRNPREKDLRPILDRVGFALASLPRHELTKPRELWWSIASIVAYQHSLAIYKDVDCPIWPTFYFFSQVSLPGPGHSFIKADRRVSF